MSRYPAKNWLVHCCALCGEPFPLTRAWHANMSGTTHQSQLPCPCETREPPEPERPKKPFSKLSKEEILERYEIYACCKARYVGNSDDHVLVRRIIAGVESGKLTDDDTVDSLIQLECCLQAAGMTAEQIADDEAELLACYEVYVQLIGSTN